MHGKVLDSIGFVAQFDPEIAGMMQNEFARQRDGLELIASENFASPAVIAAMGSVLTNKYAEGLPGKRYYGGCHCVDELESICIQRAKELFGAEFANVQPHSGAQANMAVQVALLQPGDTMMGMSLANGGHLSHGSPANLSGKYYNVVSYDVNHETGLIDYDKIRDMAKQCRPKMIIAGASAYPRAIDFKIFADIAHEVGAIFMVDMAHIAGLVAGGVHMNPVPYADIVTTRPPAAFFGRFLPVIEMEAQFFNALSIGQLAVMLVCFPACADMIGAKDEIIGAEGADGIMHGKHYLRIHEMLGKHIQIPIGNSCAVHADNMAGKIIFLQEHIHVFHIAPGGNGDGDALFLGVPNGRNIFRGNDSFIIEQRSIDIGGDEANGHFILHGEILLFFFRMGERQ